MTGPMRSMRRAGMRLGWRGLAVALLVLPAAAEEERDPLRGADALDERSWSATFFGQLKGIHSDKDDDGLGGFFDQYEYTPNKAPGIALELGVREASFDWVEDRARLLQVRYASPAANLGVTGADADRPFLNQRALVLGRTERFALDLQYRRFRTEERRLFPETDAGGGALPFTDLTGRNDRFYRERTGFQAELRWRPELPDDPGWADPGRPGPELSFRGGRERRESQRQLRTLLNPANDWLAFTDERGDDVSDVGAGLIVVPGGRTTVAFDYDYQEFDADDAILDDDLPSPSISRSVAFVPSSRRHTGRILLQSRIRERASLTLGLQASHLDQENPETPAQRAVGFDENETIAYSARVGAQVELADGLAAGGFVKYAYRDRDLDRSTPLFNAGDGSQVDEFLESFHRIDAEGELRYRATRWARLAGGIRLLWIDRDLDFAQSGLGNTVIQPENALVNDETQMWTVFGRADLRPLPTLRVRGRLSYRVAPDTGYITDLDDYVEGELRATWSLRLARPATLGLVVRGGDGENSDFSSIAGLAPNPPGPAEDRDYERSHFRVGLTGDWAWRDDATFFASLFYAADRQGDDLQLSDVQRYFQEAIPIGFRSVGRLDYDSDEVSLRLGSQLYLSERTDAGLSYAYTFAEGTYDSGPGREVELSDENREVDSDIHELDLELRHRVREGLRLFAGYRIQFFSDGARKPSSTGSVRAVPDRSDLRHTFSFGISLNGDLLARR